VWRRRPEVNSAQLRAYAKIDIERMLRHLAHHAIFWKKWLPGPVAQAAVYCI